MGQRIERHDHRVLAFGQAVGGGSHQAIIAVVEKSQGMSDLMTIQMTALLRAEPAVLPAVRFEDNYSRSGPVVGVDTVDTAAPPTLRAGNVQSRPNQHTRLDRALWGLNRAERCLADVPRAVKALRRARLHRQRRPPHFRVGRAREESLA